MKPTPPVEIPSATTALTAPELPERLKPSPHALVNGVVTTKGPLTNGTPNTSQPPPSASLTNGVANEKKSRYTVPTIPGTQPLKLTNENATDLHLLSKEEAELCSVLRLMPKAYLAIKQGIIGEALKAGGVLKRKGVREICKVRMSASHFTSLPLSPSVSDYLTVMGREHRQKSKKRGVG